MRLSSAVFKSSTKIPSKLSIFSQFTPSTSQYYGSSSRNANEYGKTFDKILIANRGEIACRVMRTAKKMGIKSVAVYSEPDSTALHARMADEAVLVGPAPSSQSYLNIESIVRAIKETGAQAVHPGYGFLSENSLFCAALDKAGVAFIGPSVQSMEKMGDKIQSKIIAKQAGVNTIPGWDGVVESEEQAIELAKDIGYPVMLKASAGGGGKGMRIAWNESEIRENFRIAATEAKSSFGDDRLLIEKFIEEPRHIEIQIIADKHGNTLYLPERECSIQRRNQKVIEEAPSVALDQATREAMGKQAVQLAKSVGYYSAGTVEFLVDKYKNFYFLEMNTRLQVEHPITEYVTGIDLVEQMIRVAAGQKLALKQSDIKIDGWAVESRVYAEDPKTYLPCIGRLERYIEPDPQRTNPNIRCDSGITEGSEISIYYDPLICKLSTKGATRDEALDTMSTALDSYVIQGVVHNTPLLREVVMNDKFRSGKFSTSFLPDTFPGGFAGHKMTKEEMDLLAAVATKVYWINEDRGYAGGKAPREALHIRLANGPAVETNETPNGIAIGETTIDLRVEWTPGSPLIKAKSGSQEVIVQFLKESPGVLRLQYLGTVYDLKVLNAREAAVSQYMLERPKADLSNLIRSPMPGQIVKVMVKEGDEVKQGADLLVMEAMKMQNVLKATRSGRIAKVNVKGGENVAADQDLVVFA